MKLERLAVLALLPLSLAVPASGVGKWDYYAEKPNEASVGLAHTGDVVEIDFTELKDKDPLDGWKIFDSVEGRFRVRVPGAPKEETEAKNPDDKSPPTHTFVLPYKDTAYILTYTDLREGQSSDADSSTILKAARDGGLKNVKGRLISDREIHVNGYPGRDVLASVPLDAKQGIAHMRLILVKSRLYMALYVGPEGSMSPAQIDGFLQSFQIVPAEPQDGWKTFKAAEARFTVRLPGTPTEEVSDLNGGGKIHLFTLDKGEYAYILSYNSIEGGVSKADDVAALLNKGRDAMISSLHGMLLDEKPITLAGNPGKAVRVSVPAQKGTALVRSYIAGDQYYQVMLIGKEKGLGAANADRYFSSFQLGSQVGGSQPATEWKNFSSKEGGFSVDLPGEPKQEKIGDDTIKYQAQEGGTAFIVVYVTVNVPDPITDPDKIAKGLQASKDAEVKLLEGKVLSEKPIKLGDNVGVQVKFSIPDSKIPGGGMGIERFYWIGKRLYEVGVLTGNTKAEEAAFARFFDSFKADTP